MTMPQSNVFAPPDDPARIWCWWGWEPLCFYRFTGKDAPGLFQVGGTALERWYDRLHSEETVRRAAALGVNRAVTHFHKGFGLEYERAEIDRAAELTARCHRHGIRVFGYLQYGSIFHRSFFQEFPEARDWVTLDASGAPRAWCGDRERFMPCVEAAGYVEFLRRMICRALEQIGFDGLHFDNFYHPPCWCPRCRRAFGESLPDDPAAETGAARRWARFRSEKLTARMEELTALRGA